MSPPSCTRSDLAVAVQRTASSARPPVSLSAVTSRRAVVSAASCSLAFSTIVASHVACSASTLATTSASCASTTLSFSCSASSDMRASASAAFFGSTTCAMSL